MAKSKHSLALFEMLGQRKDEGQPPEGLSVPKWFKPGKREDGAAEGSSASGEAPAAGPTTASPSTYATTDDVADGPLIAVHGGRIRISLNPISAAVLVGAVFLALFVSFLAGKAAAPAGPIADAGDNAGIPGIDGTGQPTPNPDVLDVGGTNGGGQADGGGAPADSNDDGMGREIVRQSGLNYVILEGFAKKDLDAAKHAQKWFAEQGMEATIEADASRPRWGLISVLGFDFSQPGGKAEFAAYKQQVVDLGKVYVKTFAGKRRIDYHFKAPGEVKWP